MMVGIISIRRRVELARKAIGYTRPNLMVGCVIVKDGKIVGQGFHPKAGQPHAEGFRIGCFTCIRNHPFNPLSDMPNVAVCKCFKVWPTYRFGPPPNCHVNINLQVFALRDAGELAENGTAYVSLEPCNHYGRTPPCTEALIKEKVKRVVIGMVDPNAIVDSKGIRKLQDAGIEVTVGIEEELCKKLNEAYTHQMLTGKRFVTLRYSMAVNGHPLDQLGEEAHEGGGYYSKLLQEHDAIILSRTSSFVASNKPGANQPYQIMLSKNTASQIQIPDRAVVFDRMSLISVLEHCKNQGLCSVLLDLRGNCEDFEGILREGFELNLFKKLVVEVLPIWHGSEETATFKDISVDRHKQVKNLTSRESDKSILLVGYF